jgi:hypothetical protein
MRTHPCAVCLRPTSGSPTLQSIATGALERVEEPFSHNYRHLTRCVWTRYVWKTPAVSPPCLVCLMDESGWLAG